MSLRHLLGLSRTASARMAHEPDKLLVVRVNDREVATIRMADAPCEVACDVAVDGPATVEFEDAAGTIHRHCVPARQRWLHLSVRVHQNLGCQADAVVTAGADHTPGAPIGDDEVGVRFQPFFLAGASVSPPVAGRGLFARGLHFSGLVTPGNILLSCECDCCAETFLARSFHAGLSDLGYFYSASGRYTLTVYAGLEGAPTPLSDPPAASLAALEARLPTAPDGTRFAYLNPFRCPHCNAPFVDFTANPDLRTGEYYGLYLPDSPPILFDADSVN